MLRRSKQSVCLNLGKEERSLGAEGVIDGYTLFDFTTNDAVDECLCLLHYAIDLRIAIPAFTIVN